MKITDEQFAALQVDFSEAGRQAGMFTYFCSNEYLAALPEQLPTGGAYIGVGPEQNLSYIAKVKPEIAFIVDYRRMNAVLHLFYRELFGFADDRAMFLSALFARPIPDGLTADSSASDLMKAFSAVPSDIERSVDVYEKVGERFASAEDEELLLRILERFSSSGPGMHATGITRLQGHSGFAEIASSCPEHFLASEDSYRVIRDMQRANRIVPVTSCWRIGPALPRIAGWVQGRGMQITTLYLSNIVDHWTIQDAAAGSYRRSFNEHTANLAIASQRLAYLPPAFAERWLRIGWTEPRFPRLFDPQTEAQWEDRQTLEAIMSCGRIDDGAGILGLCPRCGEKPERKEVGLNSYFMSCARCRVFWVAGVGVEDAANRELLSGYQWIAGSGEKTGAAIQT